MNYWRTSSVGAYVHCPLHQAHLPSSQLKSKDVESDRLVLIEETRDRMDEIILLKKQLANETRYVTLAKYTIHTAHALRAN